MGGHTYPGHSTLAHVLTEGWWGLGRDSRARFPLRAGLLPFVESETIPDPLISPKCGKRGDFWFKNIFSNKTSYFVEGGMEINMKTVFLFLIKY